MHISSSYAKILGEKLFRTWEFPRSGSKAKDGGKKERRAKVGDNKGQATHGARKHAWRTQAARKPPGPKTLTPRIQFSGKPFNILFCPMQSYPQHIEILQNLAKY